MSLMRMGEMLRLLAVAVMALLPAVFAQHAPQPAPGPSSDGVAIDQGVAYVLLFAALVVTYLVHPLEAFPYNIF